MALIFYILICFPLAYFTKKLNREKGLSNDSYWEIYFTSLFARADNYFFRQGPVKVVIAFLHLVAGFISVLSFTNIYFKATQDENVGLSFFELFIKFDELDVFYNIAVLAIAAIVVIVYLVCSRFNPAVLISKLDAIDAKVTENLEVSKETRDLVEAQGSIILPIAKFCKSYIPMYKFVPNECQNKIIKTLQDPTVDKLRFVALSGTGKSMMIAKAFESGEYNNVYCCTVTEADGFKPALHQFIADHKDEDTLLILDDCHKEIFEEVLRVLGESKIRLVSFYNNPSESTKHANSYKVINLDSEGMTEAVRAIVASFNLQNKQEVEQVILKNSDDNPEMAIRIYKVFQETNNIESITDDNFIKRILQLDGNNNTLTLNVLQSVSLFQPLGYTGRHEGQFDAIMKCEDIADLGNINHPEEKARAVVEEYIGKKIVERQSDWINIRQRPIAVWLMTNWFSTMGKPRFKRIINYLSSNQIPGSTVAQEAFCRRVKFMQSSKNAGELTIDLCKADGLFSSEEVICSDFGSRLFLSFAAVNPVATSECIYNLFATKDVEYLHNQVKGDARRNLVWALEKLCFPKESFHKSAITLGRLALAENEECSNNAEGQFKQLFHVGLPGTESNLNERLEIIKHFANGNKQEQYLALTAIEHALAYGHFNRDGGSETFGFKQLYDYSPTGAEIFDYWKEVIIILKTLLNDNQDFAPQVMKIIASQASSLASAGCYDFMFQLFEIYEPYANGNWGKIRETLMRLRSIRKHKCPIEGDIVYKQITEWLAKMSPLFVHRFEIAHRDLNDEVRFNDRTADRIYEAYKPFVDEFVRLELYFNKQEIEALLYHDVFFYVKFNETLLQELSAQQKEDLFDTILDVIKNHQEEDVSRYLLQLCGCAMGDEILSNFINNLKSRGYVRDYVAVVAQTCPSTDQQRELFEEITNGDIDKSYLSVFERYYICANGKALLTTIKLLQEYFGSEANVQIYNIISQRFVFTRKEDCPEEIKEIFKQVVLWVIRNKTEENSYYDFSYYLHELIEQPENDQFAIEVCKAVIDGCDKPYSSHRYYNDVFFLLLLQHHKEAVWTLIADAIATNLVFYFLNESNIGCGSGFGETEFFKDKYEELKEYCRKYPDVMPHRLAKMTPVFNVVSDGEGSYHREGFHPFVLWLFDNYGNKEMLDGLSSNMGTYSWVGSTLGLLKDKRKCYESVINHKNPEVRKWAQAHIKSIDNESDREMQEVSYNSMAYGV